MPKKVPFNRAYLTHKEESNIKEALLRNKLSGDGDFTKKCEKLLESKYKCKKVLLTSSCTDALEITSTLLNIQAGDEVIVPSYTFVSTANAFANKGAKIVFIDSLKQHPNMNHKLLHKAITKKTKAIIPVHYGGFACDMDYIMKLAEEYQIIVIEDAAHSLDSQYKKKYLGTLAHMGTFSFHDTKNITCGEGGALFINDSKFIKDCEIIREKGTNRASFFRGEIDKYSWVSLGSSHLPSEITAAFLYAQLEKIDDIQELRQKNWQQYHNEIKSNNLFEKMPLEYRANAHLFYLKAKNIDTREKIILKLKELGIGACFHYLPLESSEFAQKNFPKKTV